MDFRRWHRRACKRPPQAKQYPKAIRQTLAEETVPLDVFLQTVPPAARGHVRPDPARALDTGADRHAPAEQPTTTVTQSEGRPRLENDVFIVESAPEDEAEPVAAKPQFGVPTA